MTKDPLLIILLQILITEPSASRTPSMLLVKTKIKESSIHGIGLFADEFIPKGTIVWKFTPGFDLTFTREQILAFPEILQIYFSKYSWKSSLNNHYCFSSDNGKYFNHSDTPNTISEHRDGEPEEVNIALKDIRPGEELTDNYSSFETDFNNNSVLEEIREKYHLTDEADPRVKYAPALESL